MVIVASIIFIASIAGWYRLLSIYMDITFRTGEGNFNFRVCAIIMHNDSLLAMHDDRSPYYYLPGGRVRLHETAEQAIVRELQEELHITADIVRPLWFDQNFFTEDVNHERYHEIGLYFLMDISRTPILSFGESFSLAEGNHLNRFEWLPFEQLENEYLYPTFIKKNINDLPATLEMIVELE